MSQQGNLKQDNYIDSQVKKETFFRTFFLVFERSLYTDYRFALC